MLTHLTHTLVQKNGDTSGRLHNTMRKNTIINIKTNTQRRDKIPKTIGIPSNYLYRTTLELPLGHDNQKH